MLVATQPPFVGRAAELSFLARSLSHIRPGVVVVEGEAGIGKTRLVTEALDRQGPGLRVVRAAGDPAHDGIVARLSGSSAADRRRAGAVFDRMVCTGPATVVVEDVRWTEPGWLDAIPALVERVERRPIRLLLTTRPSVRGPAAERVLALVEGERLAVGGLGMEETAQLARAVAPPIAMVPSDLAERTGGNPALTIALAAAPGGQMPRRISAVLIGQLEPLPRATVEALRVASVLGRSFAVSDLAALLGRPAAWLVPVLDPALRAGMLVDDGRRLGFRPGLLQEAIYVDIPPAMRAALHADAGRVLAAAGASAATVVHHLAESTGPDVDPLPRQLRSTALDVLPQAPAVAVDLLRCASRLATAADRDTALSALAAAHLRSGAAQEAERMAREVLARPHELPAGGAMVTLVEALQVQDRMAEAAVECAVFLAEHELRPAVRARLRAERAKALVLGRDSTAAAAEAAGTGTQDPTALCLSRAVLALVASGRGRTRLALDLGGDAVRRGLRIDGPSAAAFARYAHAVALLRADRVADAFQEITAGSAAADPLTVDRFRQLRAVLLYRTGRWDELPAQPGEPVERMVAALVELHHNDLDRADALLATGMPDAFWAAYARGRCAEARGRLHLALDELRRAWAVSTRQDGVADYAVTGPDLVRMLVAAGRRTDAVAVAAQVAEIAERGTGPGAQAAALRCATLLGDPDAATRLVELLPELPFPHMSAVAREEAAAVLTIGQVEQLQSARDRFRELGAQRDLARVEATLRGLGVRGGARGKQTAAARGWASLTRAELQVVRLATQGMTNREIAEQLYVSPRTVETHLTHVFAKLDLSGRPELRAAAASHRMV
ncbi:LuxR C-terminal-related transcriptional regulator [Pseudonocardia sp. TRM90224]|uniref:LuxR C-terminal-related transcriptional regulator n=1 Tax=Pseudonocardia sp. TRM90224 TaxID=2812678 RepID=UPI001E2FEE4D|nr:LuxR family transcriptional regulator [Pseudonocardia sp. TRM90224]